MSEITVHVQFVDEQTGEVFAETDAPLSTLPQSFEAATHLEIEDQHYDVVTANPVTADLFSRSRKLVLTLRRVHVGRLNTKDILFTLPTICDAIPPVAEGTNKLNKHVFELHEDNWRQVELISLDHMADIQAELIDIRHIHDTASVGIGYRSLHVRERITAPLSMPLSALLAAFPGIHPLDGIAYQGVADLIEGGFGYDIEDAILFGQKDGDIITTLCLEVDLAKGYEKTFISRLEPLMASYGLILVDWCRSIALTANELDSLWAK